MHRTGIAAAVGAVCAALVLGVSTAPTVAASSTPVSFPSSPKGLEAPVTLPKEVDPPSRYVPQNSCQPGTPEGVKKLRDLVMRTYKVGGLGNTARGCSEGVSEHADGRAWDWMVHTKNAKEKKAAADFLAWVTKDDGRNARRLGIMYVIYNKKIWAVYRSKEGWRPSAGHTDHIHVSFSWNGARGNTSFWTGEVHPVDHGPCTRFAGQPSVIAKTPRTTPCYAPVALVKKSSYGIIELGSRASSVKVAQKALGRKQTGVFDSAMREAVREYQKAHDLPVTGTVDVPTWASLVPSKVTSSTAKGLDEREAARKGKASYRSETLKERSTGTPVLVLQTALGMKTVDRNGYLGPVTLAAVRQAQEDLGRPVTGTWSAADWDALAR